MDLITYGYNMAFLLLFSAVLSSCSTTYGLTDRRIYRYFAWLMFAFLLESALSAAVNIWTSSTPDTLFSRGGLLCDTLNAVNAAVEIYLVGAILCELFPPRRKTGAYLAAGAVLLALDYRRVLRQHRRLELLRQLPEELADALPPSDTVKEADYRSLVTLLAESRRAIRTQEEQRYGDMVDYYTMWAHQIKTPIASMRLTLQNEDSDLARSLSGDLMRVEQYVEMVLVFLRLDSSTTDYVIRSHSLDDIVRPAVRKFAGEFIRRRLRLDYQSLDRTVVTDAKWLGFVVEQVLSNALKYTVSGSVTIAMDGDDLCIRDTGMGIAPEDLPRIFDRGFTGLNGRRDTRASGIGLYLCRRICRSLGHTIRASSVPNQGTEIRIGLGQKKTLPE